MFAQMRAFLAPPFFSDEDQNRTSRILNIILLAIVALLILFLSGQLLTGTYTLQDTNFYILAGLEILVAGLWVVLQRGYLRVAAYGVVFTAWIGLVFLSFNAGGVRDSAFIALIVTSMIASLVLGWRQALYFLALTSAAGWLLAYFEDRGQILLELASPYELAAELTIVLLLFAILLYLLVSNSSNALEKARQSNEKLRKLSDQLEEQVVARTQELILAANVAQGLSTIQDLGSLLDNAVVLIQSRFDLYYAQVYLLDESGEFLQLHAGTGDAGQALLQQKHRLRLDGKSINSTAVANKQPVIVADTSQSDIFQPNPLLPLTRSELAVPLILENQVVGVLNLQSSDPESFTAESLPAFQTLAGQLTIAINNANLFAEREQVAASLREEQNRVQAILEAISVPMVISFVSDGRAAYTNDAMAEIIRAPRAELLHKATPDFYADPAERQKFLATLQQTDQVVNYELQLKRMDGDLFWALISARAINFQGQPAVLTTLIDITDRHNAEESLAKRAAELQAVAQVGSIATSILDSDTLLQNVVDLTKERFGLYHAHIYLLDEKQEHLALLAGAGESGRQMVAEERRIPLEQVQSLVARAARTRQGVIVNDVQQDPGFLPNPLLPDTRSEMAVPILIGQNVLGVLDIQSDQANIFTAADINIYSTLAAQVAVALQNAGQYQETQTALAETEGLLNVTRVASQSLALEETLSQVLHQILAMKQYEAGLISMINPNTQSLELVAHHLPEDLYQTLRIKGLDGTLCDLVYRSGRPFALNDMKKEAPIDVSGLLARGFHSYQGVPIEARGEVLGTICLFSSQRLEKGVDFKSLIAIGQQIGVTVQNAMLFSQTQAALAETNRFRRLVEAFNQGVAIAELDGAINYANPALLRFLGFDDLAQVQGESITNFYPGEMRVTAELEAIPTALEQGVWSGEMVLQAPDGREMPTLESYTLIANEAGEPTSLALVITNITERKEAEKAQQRLAAALEARLQEVNALQRAMTHEGWQAFFAAKERPIQGFRYWDDELRLISRNEVQADSFVDLPLSIAQAERIVTTPESSTTAVPMKVRGQTIGLIGARSPDGTPIDAQTQALLQAISAQVAEALERARLFEETELGRQQLDAQARELAVINEVAQSVSQLLQPADLLETIFRQVQRAITADAFIVATYDERANTLNYPLVYDEGQRYQPIPGRPSADNPWLQVVQSGQPILINRTAQEVAVRRAQLKGQAEQRLGQPGKVSASLMFVPLFLGQRAIGAISVQSYRQAAYSERELALLAGIANHVAVALENARLYTDAQRRAEREALLNAISQKIQSAPTVQSALQTAVVELGNALKAKRAAVELRPAAPVGS